MSEEGDENVMSFSSHENQMVLRGSPHSLKNKSDRLSLFDLVEDVENARDQLKTIGEVAIFPRRSIGLKGSEKRNYGNRSPRTPLGDTSFRTSNQKRNSTKGTPLSFSFQTEYGEKSPSRRMTADPADLAAMLRELEEEVMTDDDENENSVSQLNSSLHGTRVKHNLLNTSSMSEISIESRDCFDSNSDIDTSRCSQKSINTAVSTASEAFERLQSDRRATCDPSDILEMMREFHSESGSFYDSSRSDRRMTADPEDMAEIMRGLEEEEKIAREKDTLHDSLCGSDYEVINGTGNGRESICTVDLVHSIAEMLKEHEGSNQIPSDLLSTVSSFSIKSNSSNKNKSSQKALISSATFNFPATVADPSIPSRNSTAGDEVSQTDVSLSFSSIISDSNETIGTMDLISNINDVIADNMDRYVPSDNSNDDNTMMTVSSFGSIGGLLLNMVTDEFKQSHIQSTALVKKGGSQGLSPGLSPRRSKRLSGENGLDAANISHSKTGLGISKPDSIVECTPSKNGPFSSTHDNLRSCLTKNVKSVKKCITMSPVASAKKSVVFGSPTVAEFFKTSPATNMTPMRRDTARKMFSMHQKEDGDGDGDEEDTNVIDNSDEWDRLTNTSGGSPEPSDDEPSPLPLPIPGSPAFNKRYYATDDVDVSPVRAPFIANATSILRRSPRRSCNMSVASNISQTSNDVTGTVLLPGTLAELVNQATTSNLSIKSGNLMVMNDLSMQSDVESLSMSRDDCTEELEIDLHSLIHRHHTDLPPTLELNESDRSTSLSVRSNNTSRYSESSSVPSLGPLLGLSPSGSIPKYSQGNMTEDLSVSSPMSSVRTNESVLTVNKSSSSMRRLDTATFKNCDMNNSLTSMGDGATVELEGGLHDMMEELNSVTTSKKKSKKMKKRLSLRTKSTPQMKTSQIDTPSPWVGDMSIISTVDDDHTTRLEGNLNDLMAGVSSSHTTSLPSSPVAFLSTGSPFPSPSLSIFGSAEVPVEVENNHIQENIDSNIFVKKGIQKESKEKIDEDCANDVSTVSIKSDIFDVNLYSNDSIMINRAGRNNLALTTVRSSDIDYFNLVQGPDTYPSYADTSICSVADNSLDVSVIKGGRRSSVAGSAMMQRLHALNVGARINSLDQCGTPLAAKGSMSIGMKRHSLSINHHLARSTTKKSRASVSAAFSSRHLQSASVKGIYNPLANMSVIACSTPSKYDVLITAQIPSANKDLDNFKDAPESVLDPLPSPIRTPPVPILISRELREEFSAVALCMPIGVTEFSSSVLQAVATDLMNGEYSVEVQSAINDIMMDVMKVANEEAKIEAGSIEDMQRIWCAHRPDSDVMDDVGTLIGYKEEASDGDEIMKMKAAAEECKEISINNWSKFEDKLLTTATAIVDEKNAEILKQITLKKQKLNENSMKNMKNNRSIVSAKSLEGRRKLKELQIQLENARNDLIISAEILRATQEKVSGNLEIKKDFMIAMIVQKETNERELKITAEKEKNEFALIESKAAHDLLAAKKELHNVKQSLGLLNRLTYCRVLSYQSTCIEIEAVLSSQLRIQVIFHLSMDERTFKLTVDGAHVDLKYLDPQGLTVKITNTEKKKVQEWDSDTMLANAYFSDVMCSDDVSGPLSEVMLSQVICPADIPLVMQRISGFISCYRRSSTWLNCFNLDGWSWNVDGVNIQIMEPKKEFALVLSVRSIISGDVRAVDSCALKRTSDDSVAFEPDLDKAINTIKQRCTSPFGSFPSGQLKQAIERFLL